MTISDQMKAVEDRVFALRLNMTDVLKISGVAHSTWSRAKGRGFIRAKTLKRVEDAVESHERWKAEDDARRASTYVPQPEQMTARTRSG